MHPGAHRGLGQIEVERNLADRSIAALAKPDDLSLELRCERAPWTSLSLLHGLHFGHPFGGTAPDGGCPSKRNTVYLRNTFTASDGVRVGCGHDLCDVRLT